MPAEVFLCASCGATLASQREACAFCGVESATASSEVYDNVMVSFQLLKSWGWGVELRNGRHIGFASQWESYEMTCGEPRDRDGLGLYYVTRTVSVDFDAYARDRVGYLPKHSQPERDLMTLEQYVNSRRTSVKVIWGPNDLKHVYFVSAFTTTIPNIPKYLEFAIGMIRNEHNSTLCGPPEGGTSWMQEVIKARVRRPCKDCGRVEHSHSTAYGCTSFRA